MVTEAVDGVVVRPLVWFGSSRAESERSKEVPSLQSPVLQTSRRKIPAQTSLALHFSILYTGVGTGRNETAPRQIPFHFDIVFLFILALVASLPTSYQPNT